MGSGHPIILFDGVCNLCNGAVQFIIRHDPKGYFRFAPLQSAQATALLRDADIKFKSDTIILIDDDNAWFQSNAALRIARKLSGGWPLLYAFIIFPRFIRDGVYNWIARNRYTFFGKKDECMIPTPELKARFLD